MNVILYMAMTANGYIAKNDGNVDWISQAQWVDYEKMVRNAKVAIVGSRTYKLMKEEEFFDDCVFYVLTHEEELKSNYKNVICTVKSPKEIIKELSAKGHKEVVIVGGGETNSSFMEDGLIQEIYLVVEPHIFGRGIPLFSESDFEYPLDLLEMKMLNDSTLQLHYKVL